MAKSKRRTESQGRKLDLMSMDVLTQSAECLKLMAHPVRLRIVEILMQGEFPVKQVAEFCNIPDHQTCEHLRLMKGHGLLDSQRKGRIVYYHIATPRLPKLIACIRGTCGQ